MSQLLGCFPEKWGSGSLSSVFVYPLAEHRYQIWCTLTCWLPSSKVKASLALSVLQINAWTAQNWSSSFQKCWRSQFAPQPLPYFVPNYWTETEFTDIFQLFQLLVWESLFWPNKVLTANICQASALGLFGRKVPFQVSPALVTSLDPPCSAAVPYWLPLLAQSPLFVICLWIWSSCTFSFPLKSLFCKDSTVLTN